MADPNAPTIPFGSQPTTSFAGNDTTSLAIQPGQLLLGRYRAEKQISTTSAARAVGVKRGGQAEVWRCSQDVEPRTVVVKFHPGQATVKEDVLRKIRDFHGSKHDDILQVFAIERGPEGFYEVQEFAEGGDLTGENGEQLWTEKELTALLAQMLNSLVTLHEAGIIHRDIKPSNFFFRDPKRTDLVLGDFGIASALQGSGTQLLTDARGTSIYLAPELAVQPGSENIPILVERPSDYFSWGITLIVLLWGEARIRLYEATLHGLKTNAKVPRREGISPRFNRLLDGLLHPQSDLRWGPAEVRRWLNGEDVPVSVFTRPAAEFEYRLSPHLVARTREELGRLLYDNSALGRDHLEGTALEDFFQLGHQDIVAVLRRIQRLVTSPDAQVLALAYTLNPTLPFRFSSSQEVKSAKDFVALLDASSDNWNAGRRHLFGGALLWWVKGQPTGITVAEVWASLNESYTTKQDYGLEHFLHLLVEELRWPEMEIEPQSLAGLKFTESATQVVQLRLLRRGRGHLQGKIEIVGPLHGITLSSPVFQGPETVIALTIPFQYASPGETRATTIQVTWNKPNSKKELPLSATVVVPWNRVYSSVGTFAALGALVFGGLRALVGDAIKDNHAWLLTYRSDSDLLTLGGWLPPLLVGALVVAVHLRKGRR